MNALIKIIGCCIITLFPVLCYAQNTTNASIILTDTALLSGNSTSKVCIKDLTVSGTKKTRIYIVYREIQFKAGDSLLITDLQKELEQARLQVYNTTLFNEVKFELVALDQIISTSAYRSLNAGTCTPYPNLTWLTGILMNGIKPTKPVLTG
ncbi:MAG: hypothetical protein IPG38_07625 [Chitinophagaceae bacterium]|nr:hypothetical protein [Chitinophagaceae bacterium]